MSDTNQLLLEPIDFETVLTGDLIADRLCEAWRRVEEEEIEQNQFMQFERVVLDAYKDGWTAALKLDGAPTLRESLLGELRDYFMPQAGLAEVAERCRGAVAQMRDEWNAGVDANDNASITEYYDTTESYPFELMWWHTLDEDLSPLAYVSALHLALQHDGQSMLDFGCGVGSGSLLFQAHGFDTHAADISSLMLEFTKSRLQQRELPQVTTDLKEEQLPSDAFDVVTAMDVFEHVPEPAETVAQLAPSIRPGGILFGRFAADIDPERPSHIATDFEPAFQKLEDLGFSLLWEDRWLWGHRAYQKR